MTVLGGALLIGGGMSLAHAAPNAPEAQTSSDGLVNITVTAGGQQIGIMRDVSLASAASLAASACPISTIDLPALTNLDVNGTDLTNSCNGAMGMSFGFSQNVQAEEYGTPAQNGDRGNSESAPGHNKPSNTGQAPSAVPSTPPGQMGRQNG